RRADHARPAGRRPAAVQLRHRCRPGVASVQGRPAEMPRPGARWHGMSRVLKIGGALLGVVAVALGGLFWSRSAAGEPAPAVTAAAATVPVRQGALNGQVSQTGTLTYAAQADG